MSLAEEMLATMPLSDDSSTYSADEEPHIVINESRQAIVPNELKTIAVTGDKDIETVTFDCVRYWDGNDLSTFAIYLNYVLPDLTTGTYIPEKITTTDGDEFYHFDWQIKNNITAKSGKISFAVTAISTKPNFAGNPIVDKQWSSLPNSDCSIALGIEVSNVPSEEESSAVLAQMSAILEQIQADFDEWLKNSVVQTTGDSTTAVMSQRATTEEFDMLKARLKLYDDAYGIIATGLEITYYIAMRNSKQIDNLKSGISDQFETDSSIAYVKDVPSNAMPYAEVKKIGGMTYKDGNTLLSAKVTEVKSVGVNLLNIPQTFVKDSIYYGYDLFTGTVGSDTAVPQEKVKTLPYLKAGEYYFSYNMDAAIQDIYVMQVNNDGSIGTTYINQVGKFTVTHDTRVTLKVYTNEVVTIKNIMLKKGSTAQPHTPYVTRTLPIPAEVRPANGINENVYDYIEWAEDGSVKKTDRCKKIVVDGSADEDWVYSTDGLGGFYCSAFNNSSGNIVLSSRYSPRIYPWDESETIGITKEGTLWICAPRTSIEEWRSQLASNPIEIVYELAEPIITDISNLITADNLIGVEGGGTLTFENEYGYAVPSEVEYQVEV